MAAPHAVGMRKVYYVGATYLIDDELADTMLAYSGALARNSTSEPVTFSAYTGEDGPLVSVAFLLGPASELLYETVTSPRPDPDNAGTVEFMKARIVALSDPKPAPEQLRMLPPDSDLSLQ